MTLEEATARLAEIGGVLREKREELRRLEEVAALEIEEVVQAYTVSVATGASQSPDLLKKGEPQ